MNECHFKAFKNILLVKIYIFLEKKVILSVPDKWQLRMQSECKDVS